MWVLIATVVEVPPTVSPAYIFAHLLCLITTYQVLIILNLNGIVLFPSYRAEHDGLKLDSAANIRTTHHSTFFFVAM